MTWTRATDIPDVLAEVPRLQARRRADSIAVIDDDGSITWRDYDRDTSRMANMMLRQGIERGDRIAVRLPNGRHLHQLYFGVAKSGAATVPVNPLLPPPAVQGIVADSGAKVLVMDTSAQPDFLGELDALLEGVERPLVVDVASAAAGEREVGRFRCVSFHELVEGAGDDDPMVPVEPSDLRTLRYTSGTTGQPKGCMATHGQQMAAIRDYLTRVPPPRDLPTLIGQPMTLGVGAFMAVAMATHGAPGLLLRRFSAESVFDAVEHHRVGHMQAVPTMLYDLVAGMKARQRERRVPDVSSLVLVGYGGAPVAVSVLREFHELFDCDLYQTYGATESGSWVSWLTPADHRRAFRGEHPERLGSVGRTVTDFADLRLVAPNGDPVGEGEVGEIHLSCQSVFSGYWKRPDLTKDVLDGDWLNTKDLARRDRDGYLYLGGRTRDLIITGGVNVFASDIERVLLQHPDVVAAAVVGEEDPRWGEAVTAYVVLREPDVVAAEDLVEYCKGQLSGFQVPKRLHLRDALPTGPGGKVLKQDLA